MNILQPSNKNIASNRISGTNGRGRSGSVGNTRTTDPINDDVIGSQKFNLNPKNPNVFKQKHRIKQKQIDNSQMLSEIIRLDNR